MTGKLIASYEDASRTIEEIGERIESIIIATKDFKDNIEETYSKSDLAFLKKMSKSMDDMEVTIKNFQTNYMEILNNLTEYNQEIENNSVDTTNFQD